jgi:hypothetical protein
LKVFCWSYESILNALESVDTDMVAYLARNNITSEKANQLVYDFNIAKNKNLIKDNSEKNLQLWMKKPIEEFIRFVNKTKETKTNTTIRKETKEKGSELVFEDDNWYVYLIKTHTAAQLLGKGTKWCITQDASSYFSDYSKEATIYFLISKTLPETDDCYKIALLKYADMIRYWDAKDNQLLKIPKKYTLPKFKPKYLVSPFGLEKLEGRKHIESGEFSELGIKGAVDIPNSVITIGSMAFRRNEITKLNLGNSVITIETDAFAENRISEVNISDSVITIGIDSFYNNGIEKLHIGDSVETIGDGAFYLNSIPEINIPNSVIEIGMGAFANNRITKLTLGNSVTTIRDFAFCQNKILEVTIPNSAITVGSGIFSGCNELKHIYIDNTEDFVKKNWSKGWKGGCNAEVIYLRKETN